MGFFNYAYEGGRVPPWDVGRPQREIVRLAEAGEITGTVLDAGCGTGENALYLASLGHDVWGVDSSPIIIAKAREKALDRGLAARFLVWDALELSSLGKKFDTVIDSGLFHVFSDQEIPVYVRGLAAVLRPGGTYYMLCFSDREPDPFGPRHVKQYEIRSAFREGWKVNYIRAARFESHIHPDGAHAWFSAITHL